MATAIRRDRVFLGTVRRGLLPLPSDHQPATGPVFGPLRGAVPPPLTGRVGVVATGGSGALASVVGVVKALEDSRTDVLVYLMCSGAALSGLPLAMGRLQARFARRMSGVLVEPMIVGGIETLVGVVQEPVFGPVVVLGSAGSPPVCSPTMRPASRR